MKIFKKVVKAHPATIVLGSFLLLIGLGTLLLLLPAATTARDIAFIDALFTCTSAVCVTGLATVDTGTVFTTFGQIVIVFLIQIGGLGVMTISVAFFHWAGRSISFRQRMLMQDLFSHTPREDIFSLVKSILIFTFLTEFIGAVFLCIHWWPEFPFTQALYKGIFHSISAFCNAGFALFPDNLMRYADSILLNTTICILIIIGGIGFPVLYELQNWIFNRKKRNMRLSINTKIVLITTFILIIFGTIMFSLLERKMMKESKSVTHGILISFFQSVTCRTAGFNTVDIGSLEESTLTMMLFLMFVGASSGSCGGGVKTTSLALITAFTISRVMRKRRVNMFKKTIPAETVTRSISLVTISVCVISFVLFMLLVGNATEYFKIHHHKASFLPYLFETVSAFGTVGLSTGVTPEFNAWGKSWIIFMMIVGRVGVLTLSYILIGNGATKGIEYAEENMMIG